MSANSVNTHHHEDAQQKIATERTLNAIGEDFYTPDTNGVVSPPERNGELNRTNVLNDLHFEMRRRASNDDRRMFSSSNLLLLFSL